MSRWWRSRPAIWTLLYTLVLVALLVSPINKPHDRAGYLREDPPSSARRALLGDVLNIGVFVPLGWGLHRIARRGRLPAPLFTAAVTAGVFSLSVETVQYFVPSRYSSWNDVLANTVGACLGAWSEWRATRAGDVTPQKNEGQRELGS